MSAARRIVAPSCLTVLIALSATACRVTPSVAAAPRRIAEAEAAARRAIQLEAQLRPDTLPALTLGVLPFNQSGLDSTQAALGYGLADLLRTDLGQSHQVKIVDRLRLDAITRELHLAASGRVDTATAPRVGRLVQARRMLYGNVGAEAGRLDIGVGLADAATSTMRTAVATQTRLDDVLDTEKQIVLRVFETLGVTLTPAERRAVEERPTKNLAAFLAYGRAVRLESELRFTEARAEFRSAARLDPSFHLATTRGQEVSALTGAAPATGGSAPAAGSSLARAAGEAVDRVNGVFESPIGGSQQAGTPVDPSFPSQTVTVRIKISVPQ